MLQSFLVALGVVFPLAALMGVGAVCRIVGMVRRDQMQAVDTLVYKLFMPCMMFAGVYEGAIHISDHLPLAAACVIITVIYMFIGLLAGRILEPNDKNKAASVAGAVARENYLMFGTAISEIMYGTTSNAVVLMNPIKVPLNNVVGVIILEKHRTGRVNVLKLFWAVLKNPVVVATLLGFVMRFLPFRLPDMVTDVVNRLGNLTVPLCFFSVGVCLDLGILKSNRRTVALGCLLRMVLLPMIFLPIFVLIGFRGQELFSLMVIVAAPSAANSYPMAVAMGADGQLAGQMLFVNVLTSLGTILMFTFVLQMLGLV